MTHAFFKALLFLAAGAVIIAMHHEQDMRKMGGLRHRMPVTYWTALIGALALIGTPLFSGFYSKDALIDAVHASQRFGAGYAYWCVLLGVFVTALYTFRMIFMTFHGPERLDQHAREHFHDVGWDMKAPLVALAIPSVIIGYLTVEPILFGGYFGNAIKVLEAHDVVGELKAEWHGPMAFALHSLISAPAWLAALGVYAAWWCVLKRPEFGDAMRERFSGTYRVLVNKYYFDWFNENVLVPLARGLGVALWRGGDEVVIDGALVNGSADAVGRLAGVTRLLQSGFLYSYAFWMIIGLAVSLGWFLIHI
jgi:NADH-quinone oxidoreductase subunit L